MEAKSHSSKDASEKRTLQFSQEELRQIREALDAVLASVHFRNSQQCQSLLKYVVDHTLAGEDHLLRERVIGADVFGRKADYEPGEDPVVRIRASEVRKRLAQFYHSLGNHAGVSIQIPSGSYRASFSWSEVREAAIEKADASQGSENGVAPEIPSGRDTAKGLLDWIKRWRMPILAVLGLLLIAGVALWSWTELRPDRDFRAFWAPYVKSPRPAIISIGSNAVYVFSGAFTDRYREAHHLDNHGLEFFMDWDPGQMVSVTDLRRARDSYVALGDVTAVSNVVTALNHQQKDFQERFTYDISYAEVGESPSVLIGAFNNPMTIEKTRKLRFFYANRNEIDDHQDPSKHWSVEGPKEWHDTEDFALVSRVIHQSGDAPFLGIAGLGPMGTRAASEFVSSPTQLRSFAKSAPKGWEDKNMQVLLRIKIVDFKPVSTDIVAIHTW